MVEFRSFTYGVVLVRCPNNEHPLGPPPCPHHRMWSVRSPLACLLASALVVAFDLTFRRFIATGLDILRHSSSDWVSAVSWLRHLRSVHYYVMTHLHSLL